MGRRVPAYLALENCTLVPTPCTLVQVVIAGKLSDCEECDGADEGQ